MSGIFRRPPDRDPLAGMLGKRGRAAPSIVGDGNSQARWWGVGSPRSSVPRHPDRCPAAPGTVQIPDQAGMHPPSPSAAPPGCWRALTEMLRPYAGALPRGWAPGHWSSGSPFVLDPITRNAVDTGGPSPGIPPLPSTRLPLPVSASAESRSGRATVFLPLTPRPVSAPGRRRRSRSWNGSRHRTAYSPTAAAAERDRLSLDLEFVPLGIDQLHRTPHKIRSVIAWRDLDIVSHYDPFP